MDLRELYGLAKDNDIDVHEYRMQNISSQSHMFSDQTCHIAIDTCRFQTTAEEKAMLAHEIGHCLTGSFYNRYSPFDERSRHERKANKKAISLIIPLDELKEVIKNPWNSVYDISEHFGVPEDTVRMALEFYDDDLRCMRME